MKILFITNSLGFGGAEKMLGFVAESLNDRGHKISVVNLNSVPDYINTYRRNINENIVVYELENGASKSIWEKIRFTRDAIKKHEADIIVAFTEYPNVVARIVGLSSGIPSIMSERGDPARVGMGKGLKNKIVLALINGSKGGVFQTEGAKEFYGRGLNKRGIVIPNPIFIKGEVPSVDFNDREKTVVSVGRLDNFQKRYDVMLDAFKIFSKKHPEYILKLYGTGNDVELIKSWADERGLTDKVKFMGLTTQPMQDIAKDGMFLITSDYEGISNSLLEAMAVGLPCVSTDHTPGGARLLINDHENGLLAPTQDAEKLADAMCEFAENPSLAEKCGENAKDVINRFAPSKMIDLWENYIFSLIK